MRRRYPTFGTPSAQQRPPFRSCAITAQPTRSSPSAARRYCASPPTAPSEVDH